MKLVRVGCDSCGASLELDPRRRFVACQYCNSALELIHEDSSITSRLVRQLVGENEVLGLKVDYLETQSRLREFDAAWALKKEGMMWEFKNALFEPNHVMASCQGLVLALVVGLLLGSFEVSVIGSVLLSAAGFVAFVGWRRRQIRRFHGAVREMELGREKILRKLSELAERLTAFGVPTRQPEGRWESIFPPEQELRYEDFF